MPDFVSIIFALTGAVFACAGLFFAGAAVLSTIRSIASRNWIPVQGTIVSSDVSVDLTKNTGPTGASYDPRIVYEYEVNGRRFTGNNLNFSRFRTNSPSQAGRTIRKYPAGGSVTVYHSPWQPERSVLEPGKIAAHISGLILGTALVLFGTFFGLGGWFGFDVATDRVGDMIGINEEFAWRYFPPFVILVGAGLVAGGFFAAGRSRRARRWPTTQGKIVASGVLRERSSSGTNTTTVTGQYVYKPEVAYQYEVNGEGYVSNRIQLLDVATSNDNRAQSIHERYNPGDIVQVYYDPKNPELAVLEPGGGGGAGLIIVVGAGFIIIASIIMWFHSIVSR